MDFPHIIILLSVIFLVVIGYAFYALRGEMPRYGSGLPEKKPAMKISSPNFENNGAIPPEHTCDDFNINPELKIENVPEGAESLALVVDDPDAPAGTWVHWVVWDIDSKTAVIGKNTVPPGSVEGLTSFGRTGYDGPCPPSGTHRYFFRLYALDIKLELPAEADQARLEKAVKNHILAQAELVGLYSRRK